MLLVSWIMPKLSISYAPRVINYTPKANVIKLSFSVIYFIFVLS